MWLSSPRVDTENTHGTGDTLSAAIAAELAKGSELKEAIIIASFNSLPFANSAAMAADSVPDRVRQLRANLAEILEVN